MDRADISAPRRLRLGVALLVVGLHLLADMGLVRAFAPDLTARVTEEVLAAFTVTITTPPPSPAPSPHAPDKAPDPAGAAAEAGRKATPREVAAPRPRIIVAKQTAPTVASTGAADRSGARDAGDGTGAGGQGSGTGAGTGGSGQGGGGGLAAKAEKIAGDINSARDYPRETRPLRIGDHVVVALTVGTDGRVKGCRVARASRDAEADRITCRLATERFRFRPATDAGGRPVESVFGWRQRWFYPGEKS